MSTAYDDLQKGEGKLLADRRIALYRDRDGGLHALSSVCPHRGCDVGWKPAPPAARLRPSRRRLRRRRRREAYI